jgi:hypothetical protein
MEKIEVTLEICTVHNGVPYGLSIIQYNDPKDKGHSFKGIGVFNDGKLNSAPFTCVSETGYGYLFSKMENGRPANNSHCTGFFNNGKKQHVESLKEKTDVSGQYYYSAQINKEY